MISDTDILVRGIQILSKYLGTAETQRFVALIQRERAEDMKRLQPLGEASSIEQNNQDALKGETGCKGSEHGGDTDESMFSGDL